MSDLVKRLREDFRGCPFPSVYTTCNEAADELERLQAENAKLRKHADGLATAVEFWDDYCEIPNKDAAAYRAEFPKEPDNGK